MSTQVFRYCPHCEQRIPITLDWKLYAHYAAKERCPGSQQPVERPAAKQNRHGSRWR